MELSKKIHGWLINKFDNQDVLELRNIGEMSEGELLDQEGKFFSTIFKVEVGDRVVEITVRDIPKEK